jgi:hypothetical protein
MQAPLREAEKAKGFWWATGLGAWVLGDPRKGRESGSRGPEPAVAPCPPVYGIDQPMIRPSTRQGVAIRAHRADWP